MSGLELAFDLYLPAGDREQNLPPVLLLHGVLDSRKTWMKIAPRIADTTGRRVYALDARNHGESPWRDEMSFDILAEDLNDFLDLHRISKATVIGHSMGGRTALTLALKQPQKVEMLIVEDMTLQIFRPTNRFKVFIQLLEESVKAIPPGSNEEEAKKSIIRFMTSLLPEGSGSSFDVNQFDLSMVPLKQDEEGYSWKTNLKAAEQFLTTDRIIQTLSGIYLGDALFLYGTKSFLKINKEALTSSLFPRATILGFEGATHLIHFEYPGKFTKAVANFINGNRNPKAKY